MHESADSFLLMLNAARNGVEFDLPDPPGAPWELELSSDPDLALNDGESVIVGESAFALLRSAVAP
jgi:isoamylase